MNSKRKVTRKLYGFLAIAFLIVFAGNVCIAEAAESTNPYSQAVEEQMPEFYVNDFAGIFTEEQKNSIISKSAQLEEETGGIQVVISTVDTWGEGREGEDYTYAMYNQYKIGEESMGILITFSVNDRELVLETGRNMQVFVTDAQLDDLSEGVMGYFSNDEFAEGLMVLQDDIIEEVKWAVPEDWKSQIPLTTVKNETSNVDATSSNSSMLVVILVLIAILIIMLIITIKLKHKIVETEIERKKEIRKLNRLEEEYENYKKDVKFCLDKKNKEAKEQEDSLNKQLVEAFKNVSILENQYALLCAWRERAIALNPELDSEIEIMIENEFKDKAAIVDKEIQSCINLAANPCHIEVFQNAVNSFEALDDNAKRYIQSDIKRLYEYLEKSINMKAEIEKQEATEVAEKACNEIKQIMDKYSVGNNENYEDLVTTYQIYERLTNLQKSVFPDMDMIRKLRNLITSAKRDCEDVAIANTACDKVRKSISGIYNADEDDLDKLKNAYKVYNALSENQRKYFDEEVLKELRRLLKQAEDDYDREEKRRREERSYNNTYNSGFMYRSMGNTHNRRPSSGPSHHNSGYSSNKTSNRPSTTIRLSSSTRSSRNTSRPSTSTSHKTTVGRGGKASGATIKKKV